jgi:hypothetical protein
VAVQQFVVVACSSDFSFAVAQFLRVVIVKAVILFCNQCCAPGASL